MQIPYAYQLSNLCFQVVRDRPLQQDWQFDPTEQAELDLIKAQIAEQAQGARVLPPYLGEMGHEVQFFLGAIEPWLRSGWKIIARRPELYPEGTAILVPPLFALIDKLAQFYHARPFGFHLRILSQLRFRKFIAQERNHYQFGLKYLAGDNHFFLRNNDFQLRLKRIMTASGLSNAKNHGFWSHYLPRLSHMDDELEYSGYYKALAPSYRPKEFREGLNFMANHIGLQLRHYKHEPHRNSQIQTMIAHALRSACFLNLPLIIYGHPDGTYLPENYVNTNLLAKQQRLPLLSYELGALRNCRLMISPNSGWMDVMAWLQVPTLVENQSDQQEKPYNKSVLTRLRPFRPQIALLDNHQSIESQIIPLLARRDHIQFPADYHDVNPPDFNPAGFANEAYG